MRKNYITRGISTALVLLFSISTFAQERVAHYTFSGNANDETTYANDGQVFGATLVADRFDNPNSAYEVEGVDNYILVPQSTSLNTADYVTLSFWISVPEFAATGEYYLISHGSWDGRWKTSLPSHGKTVWTTKVADGDISDMDSDPEVLTLDTWTHVVMVHDGTNNDIYFNGILAATKERAGTLASGNTDSLTIGRESTLWGNYFKGKLDDISIFNYGMTAADVAALYALESVEPTVEPGLIAHYTFSGNANDETTNANHGQVFGATLVEDRFGTANSAYEFDGVDNYILVPQSTSLNTSDYVTLSFWLTVPEFVVTGEYYLISQGSWNGRWKASLPSHGKTVWTTKVADGDISDMDSDPEVLPLDTWTHVVMVHDGTNNDIYFNGILAATKERAGTLASGNTDSLTIGRESTLWGNYFKGRFDDIRIYDIALTAADILALYEDESGTQNSIALDPVHPVQVYPNPTNGFINIINAENSQVSVYDILGKLVLTYENKTSLGTINLSNYNGGIYFVKIFKDNATITRRINLIR
jgi:hypothetical protein